MDFVYSIRRGEEVVESGLVPPVDEVEPPETSGYQYPGLRPNPGSDDPALWSNPDAAQAFHYFLYGRAE